MKRIIIILAVLCIFSTAYGQYNINRKTAGNGAVNSGNEEHQITGTIRVGDLPTDQIILHQGFNYQIFSEIGVTTSYISSTTVNTARSGGYVVSDGGFEITNRGVVWSTLHNPELTSNEDGHTSNGIGLGAFVSDITGLTAGQTYYVSAYATNSEGTGYGHEVMFTTIPTLPEWGLIALISLTAVIGGVMVWRRFI